MILISRSARLFSDAEFGSRWNLGVNSVGIEHQVSLTIGITIFDFFNRSMRLKNLMLMYNFTPVW